jgi:tetratricopeptide (TPR) repeat protein
MGGMMKKVIFFCLVAILMSSLAYADAAQDYFNKGRKYYYQEDYDKALECFQEAVQIQQRSGEEPYPMLYMNIGSCYLRKGNYSKAEEYLEKAIERYPDTLPKQKSQAYTNLGVLYFEKGNYDEAIECHKEAIQLDPNNEQAHKNLAIALEKAENQ